MFQGILTQFSYKYCWNVLNQFCLFTANFIVAKLVLEITSWHVQFYRQSLFGEIIKDWDFRSLQEFVYFYTAKKKWYPKKRKTHFSHFYCKYNIHFFYLVSWSLFSFFDKRKNMFTKRKHQPKQPNEKRIPRPAAKSWKNPHFVSFHHYYVFNNLHDAKLDIKVSLPRVWDWILETGRISFCLRYFKHGDILKI